MFVPLIFISVIAHFPIGLVIYWVTTNLWTVGQGLVTRRLMPRTPVPSLFSRGPRKPDGGSSGDGARRKAPAPKPAAPVAKAVQPAKPTQPAKPQARRVKRKGGGGARR